MPETSEKILNQLNTAVRDYEQLDRFGLYPSGNHVTDKPEILFARRDLKEVMKQVEAMKPQGTSGVLSDGGKSAGPDGSDSDKEAIHLEMKDEITYDDFAKLQFAVGEVLSCEEVPKSRKLLKFQVKIGDQTRQILSGIKKWYQPEELVGKKVMVLVNLKPAKLAGMMSEGMLLSAEDDRGNVKLVEPPADMPSGSGIE
jgi:methionyl-tRNA synthetase